MSTGSPTREINVTPLIDILLVLLIVFLVLMPIVMRAVPVEVPHSDAEPGEPPLELKLHADLTISVDNEPAILGIEMPAQVRAKLGRRKVVFVDVDDGVPWHEVVGLVDSVRSLESDPEAIKVAVRLHEPQ